MKRNIFKVLVLFAALAVVVLAASAADLSLWGFNIYPYADSGSSCNSTQSGKVENSISYITMRMFGRVTTDANRYPWAGVSFESATASQVNLLRSAKGIRFRCQSLENDRTYTFRLKLSTIADDCHYEALFHASRESGAEVIIYFKDLRQPTWGNRVPYDQSKITGDFILQTGDSSRYNFGLEVWDLSIIP